MTASNWPAGHRGLPGDRTGQLGEPGPYRGQKTAAFEIVDVLGRAPDVHALPVGNAGNITAYWKGYREYHADGISYSAADAGRAEPQVRRRW